MTRPSTNLNATSPDCCEVKRLHHQLYLYLHTHWDREWYWSFGAYRTQLVQVVKTIVEMLESGTLSNFMLDGQTCLLEDLQEMAPELVARIKPLVGAGKLSIGPWYVLADQLLVGGESLTRNLEHGLAACQAFGKAAMVGYCPDTFGHSADLPRILNEFAIDNAVVWRGVPPLSGGPIFLWKSPDGSEVLTTQLARGYYQTAFHERVSSEKLADYLLSFAGYTRHGDEMSEMRGRSLTYSNDMKAALIPVGGDHLRAAPDFVGQLERALAVIHASEHEHKNDHDDLDESDSAPTFSASQIPLEKFVERARQATIDESNPLQLIQGELRDNSVALECERAYMLAGVLSTRLYLKRENRLMEHALLKKVEPVRTIMALTNLLPYPHGELKNCWQLLLRNHPHDSICGCSIDEVHDEMQARTKSLAGQLSVLSRQAQEKISKELGAGDGEIRLGLGTMDVLDPDQNAGSMVVFNTALRPVTMPVKVRIARLLKSGDSEVASVDSLNEDINLDCLQLTSREKITEAFLELSGVPLFKNVEIIEGFALAENAAPFGYSQFAKIGPTLALNKASATIVKSSKDGKSEKGNKAGKADKGDKADKAKGRQIEKIADAFNGLVLANEFFNVYLDKKGSLVVKAAGADDAARTYELGHKIVDTGDGGDTYNYDPIGLDSPIEAKVKSVKEGFTGPLVSSLIVEYEIDIPVGLKEYGSVRKQTEAQEAPTLPLLKRRSKCIKHKIVTEITLKAGVPLVYFDTDIDNQSTDHRLEVIFDTTEKLTSTFSENHYSVIERAVAKKATLHPSYAEDAFVPLGEEAALDRYPCQRFFIAADQCFLNNGLPEYGAARDQVSITLLRAVSWLSRNRLRTRGGGAGPNLPTPGANCLGTNRASYGWAPLSKSNLAQAYDLAELFEGPLTAFLAPGASNARRSLFELEDSNVKLMASYYVDDTAVLRLLNCSDSATEAKLVGAGEISLHHLDGRAIEEFTPGESGTAFTLKFKPWQLITVKIARIDA